jgi:hypothetical protein
VVVAIDVKIYVTAQAEDPCLGDSSAQVAQSAIEGGGYFGKSPLDVDWVTSLLIYSSLWRYIASTRN